MVQQKHFEVRATGPNTLSVKVTVEHTTTFNPPEQMNNKKLMTCVMRQMAAGVWREIYDEWRDVALVVYEVLTRAQYGVRDDQLFIDIGKARRKVGDLIKTESPI